MIVIINNIELNLGDLMDLEIIVDSREPYKIVDLLSAAGVPTKVETMEDGDYKITSSDYPYPYLFSRKTIPDLITSMDNGHFSDECTRLLQNYQMSSVVIIEGIIENDRVRKSLWSLQMAIPVSFTQDINETAECLMHYRKKIIAKEMGVVNRRPVLVNSGVNSIVTFYCNIPRVGFETAKKIYAIYPKPYDLFTAIYDTYKYDDKRWKTKKEWNSAKWNAKIDGIGGNTAEEIEAFVLDGFNEKDR